MVLACDLLDWNSVSAYANYLWIIASVCVYTDELGVSCLVIYISINININMHMSIFA